MLAGWLFLLALLVSCSLHVLFIFSFMFFSCFFSCSLHGFSCFFHVFSMFHVLSLHVHLVSFPFHVLFMSSLFPFDCVHAFNHVQIDFKRSVHTILISMLSISVSFSFKHL